MAGFIARQPNGLYCRFSSIVDTVTHYNMTAEDYIEYCKERAEEEAKDVLGNHLRPFDEVVERFYPNNMTEEEFSEIVKKMNESVTENA